MHAFSDDLAQHIAFLARAAPAPAPVKARCEVVVYKPLASHSPVKFRPEGAYASIDRPTSGDLGLDEREERHITVDLAYNSPIDINSTAKVDLTFDQTTIEPDALLNIFESSSRAGRGHGFSAVDSSNHHESTRADSVPLAPASTDRTIGNPISLRLSGAGFEWVDNVIMLEKGVVLPTTRTWAPRPKTAGELFMIFSLSEIMNAAAVDGFGHPKATVHIIVNGRPTPESGKTFYAGQDVSLPLSVWKDGMSAEWFDILTAGGAFLTGAVAIFATIFGSGWLLGFFKKEAPEEPKAKARKKR